MAILLGGLLGASLVRFAPGYGVDEQELDSRLSKSSIEALRAANRPSENLPGFYGHYLWRLAHGDLGNSRTLNRPVRQLITDRLPETIKTVALGVALGWICGLALAIPVSVSRTLAPNIVAGLVAWNAALGRDLYLLINLTMIVTVIALAANSVSDLVAHRESAAWSVPALLPLYFYS